MDNFRKPHPGRSSNPYQNKRCSLPRNFNEQSSYQHQQVRQSVPRDFGNSSFGGHNMMIQRGNTVMIDGVPHQVEYKPLPQNRNSYQARSATPPLPENANSDNQVNQDIAKGWLKLSSTNPNKPFYNYFMINPELKKDNQTTKHPSQ